jgi:DNA-binding transcriptional LysR family regulator
MGFHRLEIRSAAWNEGSGQAGGMAAFGRALAVPSDYEGREAAATGVMRQAAFAMERESNHFRAAVRRVYRKPAQNLSSASRFAIPGGNRDLGKSPRAIPRRSEMDRMAAMEIFCRVIEAGSFSAASRDLGIGQPAVSKSVAQLEGRLGVRLVLRSAKGLTPTEAGSSFYSRAKRSIEEADEAEIAARGEGSGLAGRLRISAAVTFARLNVVPRLPGFLAAHPDLEIDLVLDDRDIDLVEEGVDVSLRMGNLVDSALTARKIGEASRHVVATPSYLARAGTPRTPADLLAHDAVIYTRRGGGDVWTFTQGTADTSINVKGRIRASAVEAVREAVLADLGLAMVSAWMCPCEIERGEFVVLLREWELPKIGLWAVFPTGRMASAKARAFTTFIESSLKIPICHSDQA